MRSTHLAGNSMTKYEICVWLMGISFVLFAILHGVFYQNLVNDDSLFRLFFMMGFLAWGAIVPRFLMSTWVNLTETENRLSDKATAWTFYGMAVVGWGVLAMLLPKELLVSRTMIAMTLAFIICIFMGVRFILLACLLRRARLAHSSGGEIPEKKELA
jgi:hypothetical protein